MSIRPLPLLSVMLATGCVTILGLDEDRELAADGGAGGSSSIDGGAGASGATAEAYAARVLKDGAVAYYRMEEAAGEFENEVAGGPAAVPSGKITRAVAGKLGSAAEFDGTSGKATIGDVFDFDGVQPMSIEVWIKWRDTKPLSGPDYHQILHKGDSTANGQQGYNLSIDNTNSFTFTRIVDDGFFPARATPQEDVWMYLVGVYDGNRVKLYVNGALAPKDAPDTRPLPNTSGALVIGAATNWGYFAGAIDELAIYDKALGAATVKMHYDLANEP
ncbi:MAG: LamG domain-containing protein [Polyangiaceae bacterium]